MSDQQQDLLLQGFKKISTVRFFFTAAGNLRNGVVIAALSAAAVAIWPALSFAEMSVLGRGTWMNVATSLYFSVASVISLYLQASTWKDLYDCRREIGGLLATYENSDVFAELLRRSYSGWLAALFVFVDVLIAVISMVLLDAQYKDKLLGQLGLAFGLTAYAQIVFLVSILAIAEFWLLRIPWIFSRVFRLYGLRINQLEPIEDPVIRGLSILFSKAGLRAAAGIIINGMPVVILVSALHIEWFSLLVFIGVTAGTVIAASVFMLPQIGMHDLAVKTIQRTKAEISAQLSQPDPISALIGLQKYQVLATARKWAVDLSVLTRYVIALLSSLIPLAVRLYTEGVFPFRVQ